MFPNLLSFCYLRHPFYYQQKHQSPSVAGDTHNEVLFSTVLISFKVVQFPNSLL